MRALSVVRGVLLAGLPLTMTIAQVAMANNADRASARADKAPATPADPVAPDRIAAQTELLRRMLAVDMANVSRVVPADDLMILTSAFGPPTADRDMLANWLMRGGITVATEQGLSGIYNPLADAWLLLGWRNIGGSPRLVWAVLMEGRALREAGQPDWVERDGPVESEMREVARQSFGSLMQIPGGIGTGGLVSLAESYRGMQGSLVLDRARRMTGAMEGWSRENRETLDRVRDAVARRKGAALRSLPARLRDSLAPIAVLSGPGGDLLVMQSVLDPSRTTLVRTGDGDAEPQFSSLDLSSGTTGSARP